MGGELTDILVYRIIFNAIESERMMGSSGVGCRQKYGFINVNNTNAKISYFGTTTDKHYREDTFEKDRSSYIAARILHHV